MDAGVAGQPPREGDQVVQPRSVPRAPAGPGPIAAQPTPTAEAAPAAQPVAALPDSVRWGPIWAGLVTTLTTFLILVLLAYGLGLGQASVTTNAWVTGILGLIAFFIGGLVAAGTSRVWGAGAGLLTGFLVWALGTTLIVLLSLAGAGRLFGAPGQFFGSGGPPGVPSMGPVQLARAVRMAAWGGFLSLVVSALAAMLGGWLGALGGPIGRFFRGR
jgi:hypothetical protein